MRDFIAEIDKSYPIPSQIAVMSGNEPLDMRQVCDTVDDFEKFKSETGMELRYGGLITYEKSTKLFICEKIATFLARRRRSAICFNVLSIV